MNATVQEVKDDVAKLITSEKATGERVVVLETTTRAIKAQLDTLIQIGTVTPADLNQLRDLAVAGITQSDALRAEVDATIEATQPVQPPVA